jgi:hypothetical protein
MSGQLQGRLSLDAVKLAAPQQLDADDATPGELRVKKRATNETVQLGLHTDCLRGFRTSGKDTMPSQTNVPFEKSMEYVVEDEIPEEQIVAKDISHLTRGFRDITEDERRTNTEVLRWNPLAQKSGLSTRTTGLVQAGAQYSDKGTTNTNAAYYKPTELHYTTDREMTLRLNTYKEMA